MYLLDTDTFSDLLRDSNGYPLLNHRVQEASPDSLFISTITIAEVMQGTLALIRRLERTDSEDRGYSLLEQTFGALYRFQHAPYDGEAHRIFLSFPPAVRRVGRADCQIAAAAIRHNHIVVTRNLRHFERIPGVTCEDWTQ